MTIQFGTDGWRGLIARDFTFDNVAKVLQAFCDVFNESNEPKVVFLGHDRRFLSRDFAEHAARVLTANGVEVHLATQFCPTPCISWMVKKHRAGAGVAITASHNPYTWNGVKFKVPGGGAADEDYTRPIEERIKANEAQGRVPKLMELSEARGAGRLHDFDPLGPYVEQLRSQIDLEKIRQAAWNIVADPMYGAGAGFFATTLGQSLKELHHEANPTFGFTQPEPLEKNLSELILLVGQAGIDIGLATDGDADRIGAVDENGAFVDSHHIFALILRHLIEKRGLKGDIVKTVSTTQMIDKLAQKYQRKLHLTPIGFKHICKKFHEIEPLIGGEESGGIAIADHVHERDGILSGLMLLEIMTAEQKPLGKILRDLEAELGPHRFKRADLELSAPQMAEIRGLLPQMELSRFAEREVSEVVRLDGCRINLSDGSWVLVRPSGTEPLLRLYAEAESDQRVTELLSAICQILKL